MEHKQEFDQWALVELMGHQRIAGRVTEAEIGGSKFVRVDVPEMDGVGVAKVSCIGITKYLGPASIYAITPVTEETARSLARSINAAPISIWDAREQVRLVDAAKPQQLVAGSQDADDDNDDQDDDEDDDYPL